jgi:membrane-bound inhibitor of C-type lysozyme
MEKSYSISIAIIALALLGGVSWYLWENNKGAEPVTQTIVTSPRAGDVWAIGEKHMISWKTEGMTVGNKVSIGLRRVPPPALQKEGQEFDPLLFVNLENTGSVEWTIGKGYPDGTYVISITSYKSLPITDSQVYESAPFRIVAVRPIGGDKDAGGCLIAAGYSWCPAKKECLRPWEEYCTAVTPNPATFLCDGGKVIEATFYPLDDKFVDLELSDGRKISLPHALSASGARYAKADESFVFWNKGDTAFITEGGTTTFDGCVSMVK